MPWNPVVLSRVRHLHLRARILTDSLMMGNHRSRRVGEAIEFAGYREYVPGMNLRHLDWRVAARSDRLVVRRYDTETELPCSVVLDLSGDMGTGDAGADGYPPLEGSKAGYAITLAATMLYWFFRQGEPVGLHVVAGDGLEYRDLPSRSGRNHLQLMFLALAAARPGGEAGLKQALLKVGEHTRRRSLVTVISDGMEEPSAWLPSLAAFARRGTDLRFVHVHDRREWSLDFSRSAMFFSPEGGDSIAIDPAGAREALEDVVRKYVDEVQGGVVRFGGQYISAPSDRKLESVIQQLVVGTTGGSWS